MSDTRAAENSAGMGILFFLYFLAIGWLVKIATLCFGWGHRQIAQRQGWIVALVSMVIGAAILVSLASAAALVLFADGGRGQWASMKAIIYGYWWAYPVTIAVLLSLGLLDATKGRDALERKTGEAVES